MNTEKVINIYINNKKYYNLTKEKAKKIILLYKDLINDNFKDFAYYDYKTIIFDILDLFNNRTTKITYNNNLGKRFLTMILKNGGKYD